MFFKSTLEEIDCDVMGSCWSMSSTLVGYLLTCGFVGLPQAICRQAKALLKQPTYHRYLPCPVVISGYNMQTIYSSQTESANNEFTTGDIFKLFIDQRSDAPHELLSLNNTSTNDNK
jgi:hypothetical protein